MKKRRPVKAAAPAESVFARVEDCFRKGEARAAEVLLAPLLAKGGRNPPTLLAAARAAANGGAWSRALGLADTLLELLPDQPAAYIVRGQALLGLGWRDEGVAALRRAVGLAPRSAEIVTAAAGLLLDHGFNPQARDLLRNFSGRQDDPEWLILEGKAETACGDIAAAESCFRAALARVPGHKSATARLGFILMGSGRLAEAERLFREALAIRPGERLFRLNLGPVLWQRGKAEEMLGIFEALCAEAPGDARYRAHLIMALAALDRLDEARAEVARLRGRGGDPAVAAVIESLAAIAPRQFQILLRMDPDRLECLYAGYQVLLLARAVWADNDRRMERLTGIACDGLSRPEPAPPAIPVYEALLLPFAADLQAALAGQYSRSILTNVLRRGTVLPSRPSAPHRDGRLRIGYLSPDFRAHAVGLLVRDMFRLHDRARFSIHAYSLGADDGSEVRREVEQGCDAFLDCRPLSDEAVAARIRADGIDILIDLGGYTMGCRPEIAAMRPAPVQVSWMGFPGSMGAEWLPWIIATPELVPPEQAQHYTESVVRLPDAWVPSGGFAEAEETTRAAQNLPEDAFVFCCFERANKLEPRLFAIWKRVMEAVPGSVLWLLADNDEMREQLLTEAARLGMDAARIVFADKVSPAEHIGRQKLADLFLDTLIHSGYTTVAMALWAGLPVLTCAGQTFVSRLGAAALAAAGMGDTVVPSAEAYEREAIRLAHDRQALTALRERAAKACRSPLFDAAGTVRQLEAAYETLWSRQEAGLPPASFGIERLP